MDTTSQESQTTPTLAKIQTYVDYLSGISIASAKGALLEWSADDRIKLFLLDETAQKATEVLFDVPVKEVQNIGGSMVMLVLTVNGQKYNIQFSRDAMARMTVGGVIGVAGAKSSTTASGIDLWITKFKEQGIPMVGFKGWNWSLKVALITCGVIAVGLIIMVIVMVANGSIVPDSPSTR